MSRLPRELGPGDLVLSHFTLGRHHPIADRVAAAAAAGFAGIGLFAPDVARLRREGVDDARLADFLDAAALCLADIEVAKGWAGGPDADAGAAIEAVAWDLADRFGSRCLQAIGAYDGDLAAAGRAFASLCDRAADHGLAVALEPLPYTNIPDTATAAEIVERAGRDNGGLCIDIWHHTRAGEDRAVLGTIGADRILQVQMNDGPRAAPSDDLAGYKDDCLRNRVPPGAGEMDAVGFVAALLAAGSTAPWSLEVCDASVTEETAADHVRRCAIAMRDVLARASEGALR
jgi:sugar phosphate isomerase/epimerase